MPAIERSAGTLFPPGRLPSPDDTFPEALLEAAVAAGLLFVAELDDQLVGFAAASEVADRVHLDEVSVLPEHGGLGIGRRLVLAVADAAQERDLGGVSLTTFSDLPWNGPFYESLGFRTLEPVELDAQLRDALIREREVGMTARVAMFRVSSRCRAARGR